mmetsp:Transcript_5940/g.6442  ORF Transcript_5940/g.6442 Transcript_5940/m.6442 type:complete len:157 (+) Transcript_5940:64-534(+)
MRGISKLLMLAIMLTSSLYAYAIRQSKTAGTPQVSYPLYKVKSCKSADRCVKACKKIYIMGCVCYNDGTCEWGNIEFCTACQNPNVYGVISGNYCPATIKIDKVTICRESPKCRCDKCDPFPTMPADPSPTISYTFPTLPTKPTIIVQATLAIDGV